LSYRLPCHPLLMFENNSSIQQSGLTAMVAGVLRVIAPCPPYHGKPRPAVVAAIHRASRPTSASGATVAATFPAPPLQKRRAWHSQAQRNSTLAALDAPRRSGYHRTGA
jgi:hypothetical protein